MSRRRGMFSMASGGLAALVLTAIPPTARAQQAASADTTRVKSALELMAEQAAKGGAYQARDSVVSPIGIRFAPTFNSKVTGDVSSVGMANSFGTTITTPFGSLFNFRVAADEKHYRLQDKFDENKQLSASVVHTFSPSTTGSIGLLDSRVFNRSIIPGGAFQDYIFNDKSASAGIGYSNKYAPDSGLFEAVRLDGIASGSFLQGERTYKDDQSLTTRGNGGVSVDVRDRNLTFDVRGTRKETWDRSETTLQVLRGLGSSEDSLATRVAAELGDSILVDAKYVYFDAERTWADQAQGSLGGQVGGVQNVFQETERRSQRSTVLTMRAKVWKNFRIDVVGNHDSQLADYVIQETRFSRTVTDGLKGTVIYTAPWKKTDALVTLENVETLRDFGPLSVSSYNDTRKKASLAVKHRFRPTFTADLSASTMLTRSEYLDTEANPRDRDQVDTSVNLRIGSSPFNKLTTSVSLAYSASEFINIDASQSENNRTRDLYELKPGFTYFFSERLTVSQLYTVAIEYTDFIYEEENNFLDRNLIFSNKFDFKPTRRIWFVFDYAYNFHDNGSYLPDPITGKEELTVQGEDRRDRVNLRLDYRLVARSILPDRPDGLTRKQAMTIFAEQRYSRFEDRSVLTGSKTVSSDGQVMVGARGSYEFRNGGTLDFSLARVRRSTRFGSEAEKNYWDMQSTLVYPF